MALEEIKKIKLDKVKSLREGGINPYPSVSGRTDSISGILNDFENLSKSKEKISITGRIIAIRGHGGSVFFDVRDEGAKVQALIKEDSVGAGKFAIFNNSFDVGDFIEVDGILFKTKKEEKTVEVSDFKILSKALLPLPEKWHGLQDVEERLRKRYLDLIMNPLEKELFIKKSRFWQSVRNFLIKEGGLEVETPVLERIPGGADAEPFATHMNALDIDLYLRISLELNLKRLIVAGYEKVFEIGRIFRNEGMDREHLQDYTQMEMYWAYFDYKKLMELLERMYKEAIKETIGSLEHKYHGHLINWDNKWPEVDYYEIFKEQTGVDLKHASEKDLQEYGKKEGIDVSQHIGRGRLIDVIFKKKVRPILIQPCFLVRPPVDVEPLAKRWAEDEDRVERFQILAGGTELGKGFSELNDPADQRKRFEEQMRLREAGDKEAQMMDEDFVEALEYGMPPTAGFGMSERLFAFIMDKSVREAVIFPLMKPR